jgi:NADPH-dependent 2,4-dienoyl-CoA reductase/sulfur reductase-like enzyme
MHHPEEALMQRVTYLIVGGGMTAASAVAGIRERDPDGSIAVVSAEAHPPYRRPHLSKKLWAGGDEEKIWIDTGDATFVPGRRIVSLDLDAHRATDDAGDEYAFDKVLLATGGSPRRLGGDDGEVVYFRTLDDYRRVKERAQAGSRVVVIGGGFIGSEIAAALVGAGAHVTMLFPEPAINSRLLPADLADFVTAYYKERGVEVLPGETVASVSGTSVTLGSGRAIDADVVVAGLGIVPETALAEAAGLEVDNGIVVDELGRAGRDDVYAAGDVANYPSPVLGRRFRVEHEDHANTHGRVVGANMAGAEVSYDHLPFFYSDLFDLGYEAVGEVDARLETVADWETPFRKGVVTYLDAEHRPRGVLLWDVWGKVDEARERIRAGEPVAVG